MGDLVSRWLFNYGTEHWIFYKSYTFLTNGPTSVSFLKPLFGSLVWDPGSLAIGAGETSAVIPIAGANFGQRVEIAAPYDLQGVIVNGYISSPDNVTIRVQNGTNVTVDFANGIWIATVRRD